MELRVKSDLRNHQAIVTVQPPSNRGDGFSLVALARTGMVLLVLLVDFGPAGPARGRTRIILKRSRPDLTGPKVGYYRMSHVLSV